MSYFFVTLAVLLVVILAMAIGVIIGNKALKGSCGGLSKVMGDDCIFCEKKDQCKKLKEA
jgi:hypothetical protein